MPAVRAVLQFPPALSTMAPSSASPAVLLSGTFTRDSKDLLGAEDEMIEAVVGQLQNLFSPAEHDAPPVRDEPIQAKDHAK